MVEKTVKRKAAKCMQMFAEEKAMLLHYQSDNSSLDVVIKKDFQFPISGCFVK